MLPLVRNSLMAIAYGAAVLAGSAVSVAPLRAQATADVDTALVLAVDVSNSVDATRYKLQMEGIAQALDDPGVIAAITSGPHGAIALALVPWADHARVALPWRVIRSRDDAVAMASDIRKLAQVTGEYTCVARMFEFARQTILSDIPVKASRMVIDVSGDGLDNCSGPEETIRERDALVSAGVTINGLPIIVKGENEVVGSGAYRAPGFGLRELTKGPDTMTTTLDAWYNANVIGGAGAFLLKANGFEDFGRAFRQKFVSEISMVRDLERH